MDENLKMVWMVPIVKKSAVKHEEEDGKEEEAYTDNV